MTAPVVEELWLRPDGPRLYARLRVVADDAPVVVLLCGLGFHTFEYEPLAESLTALGISTLSVDYRGHGRSDGPRGAWTIDQLVDDARTAIDVLDRRGLGPVSVFGNSLGAMVAVALGTGDDRANGVAASNCPARVPDFLLTRPRRILLAAATPLANLVPLRVSVNHFYSYRQLTDDPAWVARIAHDPLVTAARRLTIPTYHALLDWDGTAAVRELHTPILLIRGNNDRLQPGTQTQLLYDAANQPKDLLAVGAGHLPHLDDPTGIAHTLHDWLSR